MLDKSDLRKCVKAAVKALSLAEKQHLSDSLLEQVEAHSRFAAARTVMLFYSLPDEVCTHAFVERWAAVKTVLLPVVDGDELELRRYIPGGELCESAFHIGAPVGQAFTAYADIDLVLVPGVAFDAAGNRMGRGRGYYDRFLSQPALKRAYKLGICYPCQLVEQVPTNSFDVPVDAVVAVVPGKE